MSERTVCAYDPKNERVTFAQSQFHWAATMTAKQSQSVPLGNEEGHPLTPKQTRQTECFCRMCCRSVFSFALQYLTALTMTKGQIKQKKVSHLMFMLELNATKLS